MWKFPAMIKSRIGGRYVPGYSQQNKWKNIRARKVGLYLKRQKSLSIQMMTVTIKIQNEEIEKFVLAYKQVLILF